MSPSVKVSKKKQSCKFFDDLFWDKASVSRISKTQRARTAQKQSGRAVNTPD